MILTGSSIKEWQVCPQRWVFSFLNERVPVATPVPFTGGKLWHSFVEGMLFGDDREALKTTLRQQAATAANELDGLSRFDKANELRTTWTCLEQAADYWKDKHAGPTVCVEQAMIATIGTLPNGEIVQFAGIPDRVRRIQGKLVHTQTRTLHSGTPMVPYIKAFQRNTHELLYAWLIQQAYPDEPYFGSELQVLLKAKLWSDRKCSKANTKWHQERSRPSCDECNYQDRVREQLRQPEELFIHELIPIDPAQVKRALEDTMQVAFGMQRVRDGEQPVQNRDADLGSFGNSLCPYFGICVGEEKLDDDALFKKKESRYEERTEEQETGVA